MIIMQIHIQKNNVDIFLIAIYIRIYTQITHTLLLLILYHTQQIVFGIVKHKKKKTKKKIIKFKALCVVNARKFSL